jgi:hypothetical protein
MKRLFKRFIAIAFAIMLFAAPTTNAYAATNSQPVLVMNYPEYYTKQYQYQPSPLTIRPGNSGYMLDYQGIGMWQVPANMRFTFSMNTYNSGVYVVQVIEYLTGDIVYSDCVINGSTYLSISAKSSATGYFVTVENIGSTDVNIIDYTSICYNN